MQIFRSCAAVWNNSTLLSWSNEWMLYILSSFFTQLKLCLATMCNVCSTIINKWLGNLKEIVKTLREFILTKKNKKQTKRWPKKKNNGGKVIMHRDKSLLFTLFCVMLDNCVESQYCSLDSGITQEQRTRDFPCEQIKT